MGFNSGLKGLMEEKSVGKSTFFAELKDIIRKGSANISRKEIHHVSKYV
jgi:hypothetical protein